MQNNKVIDMLVMGLGETLYMTFMSTLFSYIIGLPLGILLTISERNGIYPCRTLYNILDIIVNIVRSIPFLILLVAVIPFTRFVVGTAIGANATIVPLVIASAPFVARLVQSSLLETDKGIIEAAESMGASKLQIILKVMIPESLPSLINGCAIAVATILSYSAMAGFVGGGGLGTIAINYGYYRYQTPIMITTVVLLVVVVQVFQWIGTKTVNAIDKRKI